MFALPSNFHSVHRAYLDPECVPHGCEEVSCEEEFREDEQEEEQQNEHTKQQDCNRPK